MADSRTIRVLVVAPGETPLVVHDALTAVAANDRNCFDEVHVLTSADVSKRLCAVLLKPGTASELAERCRRLGIAKADVLFGRRTIHTLGSGTPSSIADDALNTLGKLCGDPMNHVTVVASSDAGALGVLAHSAFQMVAGPADRFFSWRSGRRREAAPGAVKAVSLEQRCWKSRPSSLRSRRHRIRHTPSWHPPGAWRGGGCPTRGQSCWTAGATRLELTISSCLCHVFSSSGSSVWRRSLRKRSRFAC